MKEALLVERVRLDALYAFDPYGKSALPDHIRRILYSIFGAERVTSAQGADNILKSLMYRSFGEKHLGIIDIRNGKNGVSLGWGQVILENLEKINFTDSSRLYFIYFSDYVIGVLRDQNPDTAMSSNSSKVFKGPGGIDLTSDKALTVQNNGQAIKFHLDPAQMAQWQNSPGVTFDIVDITPMTNLRSFLSQS